MLIGSLGKDAETKILNEKNTLTKFSLATTRGIKRQDGSYENKTTWHQVTAFNFTKSVTDHLKKGAKIYVEGRQENSSYEKDGVTKYTSEVITETIILFDTEKQS